MGMFSVDGGAAVTWPRSCRKLCSYCDAAPAILFCVSDTAFFCVSCDSKLHADKPLHQKVWICDVCEQSPAVLACKADTAALCAACDREIHAANPLTRRHERVSLSSFYHTAEKMVGIFNVPAPSQPPPPPVELMLLDSESPDNFLDLDYYRLPPHLNVVPVRTTAEPPPTTAGFLQDFSPENGIKLEFIPSHFNSFPSNNNPSLTHTLSSSSIDFGVVPDGSSMSELSYSFPRSISMDIAKNPGDIDREARVLRYKEKRKRRKFEKTIRYASRKAYAEVRPRIKGRFAKRPPADDESDGRVMFAGTDPRSRYGVVSSYFT